MAYTKGGGSTIYSFIFERVWLKRNSVQRHWGGLYEGGGGLHERVGYKQNCVKSDVIFTSTSTYLKYKCTLSRVQ